MKLNRPFWAGILTGLAVCSFLGLQSCHKGEDKPFVNPMYYQYFPLKVGMYKTYDADSVLFYTTRQHIHFQLKEVISGTTKSNDGETMYLIQRYTRPDSLSGWQLANVYTARRNDLEAVRTEGNTNYLKMVFPVQKDRSWEFNKYNMDDSMKTWKSSYIEVHTPFQLNSMKFDSTVLVEYKKDEDFITDIKYYERYAANVGLISIDRKELEIQPGQHPNDPPDTSGFHYTQTLIDYSK